VSVTAIVGLGWASYEAYHHYHFLIENFVAVANWPATRIRKEEEFQLQLNRIEKKLSEIQDRTVASADKIEQVEQTGRTALGKLDKLRRASGSVSQAPAVPPSRNSARKPGNVIDDIQSRIDATIRRILERLSASDVYVNSNIIGAVAGTQPFGGSGLSGTGPKTGGPSYVSGFPLGQVVSVNTKAGGNASLLVEAG
jgi:hypothetical protein